MNFAFIFHFTPPLIIRRLRKSAGLLQIFQRDIVIIRFSFQRVRSYSLDSFSQKYDGIIKDIFALYAENSHLFMSVQGRTRSEIWRLIDSCRQSTNSTRVLYSQALALLKCKSLRALRYSREARERIVEDARENTLFEVQGLMKLNVTYTPVYQLF